MREQIACCVSIFCDSACFDGYERMKRLDILSVVLVLLLTVSCRSAKNVLYLQDLDSVESAGYTRLEPTIQPGDLLSITVNSKNPELSAPFNLPMVSYTSSVGRGVGVQYLQGHLVGTDGTITFPLLGKINASGLTKQQLIDKISRELIAGNYIKEPIVTISFQNFKITVLGEVSRPGSFTIDNERVTIFDAIGMAGDMTIYGRRDNVIVVREANGKREIYTHDLRSKEVFRSPCFYLAQNDVVFVNPNNAKIQMSEINQNNNVGVWLSLVGSVTSVSTLVMTVVRNSKSSK